jgi:hypothetical protein
MAMKIFVIFIILFNISGKVYSQDDLVDPGYGFDIGPGYIPPDSMPDGLPTGPGGDVGTPPNDDGAPWDPGSGGGDPWNPPSEGGEDPDNCYYCDGDSDTGGQEGKNQIEAAKIGFKAVPSVMVDADGYTYIINLSENAAVGRIEPEKEPVSDKGFKVIKMRRGGLSVGVSGEMMIAGFPGIAPNIGLTVGGNVGFVQERFVATYPEIKKLAFIKFLPTKQSALDELANGDSITFLVSGTIAVHAGIILGGVSGGVEANVTGEWVANVRKIGPQRVQVAYTRGKIGSVAITAGSIGLKAAKSWYKELTETQAYEFDLSKPDGWTLYKRMLRGDVKTVKKYYLQELTVNRWSKYAKENKLTSRDELVRSAARKWKAKSMPTKYRLSGRDRMLLETFFRTMTVKMITIGTRQTTGTAATVKVGVPIFFSYNWNTGDKSVVVDRSREIADGLISTNYYGVYKTSKGAEGVWTRHALEQKIFLGGIKELTFLNPGDGPKKMIKIFGQVKYEFHQEKWREGQWDEKMTDAAAFLGFRKEITGIRRPYAGTAKFGQNTADLLLGEKTFQFWMNWAKNNKPDMLVQAGTEKVEEWFNDRINQRTELCRGLVRPLCKKSMNYEVEKQVPKALIALRDISEFMPTGQESSSDYTRKMKYISKAMAEFGKSFTTNQFIMNSFLDLAKSGDGDQYLVFQWQGSPFPRGFKVLIPSKYYKFRGHQICGLLGAPPRQRCDSPTNMDPM